MTELKAKLRIGQTVLVDESKNPCTIRELRENHARLDYIREDTGNPHCSLVEYDRITPLEPDDVKLSDVFKYVITDDLIEVFKDMLLSLEIGDDIGSTSILHEEFRSRMINYGWIEKSDLEKTVNDELEERGKPREYVFTDVIQPLD
jgi:hypothetical protein